MDKQEIVNACSEAAHEAWLKEKLGRMRLKYNLPPSAQPGLDYPVLSWPSETGEEQLVHWDDLSEHVREFDRLVVGAIVDVMIEKGVVDL